MPHFSRAWFALGFCIAYPLCLLLDGHLFLYYPLIGQWSFHPLPDTAGPAMQWYGLMASAGLVGGVAGLLLPGRDRSPALLRWTAAITLLAMAASVYLLRGFFV